MNPMVPEKELISGWIVYTMTKICSPPNGDCQDDHLWTKVNKVIHYPFHYSTARFTRLYQISESLLILT